MGVFLEGERIRQAAWRTATARLSPSARAEGVYKSKPRPFCLPRERSSENLFEQFRQPAIDYFARSGIPWHDGCDGGPSNHLCDSQVCCVNFLFPFAQAPAALADLLRPVFPQIARVLPIESEHQFLAFEWIGLENYLGEKVRGGRRTRGANCTSVDAAALFETATSEREVVLIEWKYTESYGSTSLKISDRGTDRTLIYRPLFDRGGGSLNAAKVPAFDDLFYEPFYQMMRQQFLAHEMEKAQELGAKRVRVLHIEPRANPDIPRVTSPNLRSLGGTSHEVWDKLLVHEQRFARVFTEDLFGRFPIQQHPGLRAWWDYANERYPWIRSALPDTGVPPEPAL